MAKQTKQQTDDWARANDMSVATMAPLNGSLFKAMSETFQDYVDGMSTLNNEMTSFISGRLRRDAEFGQSFCACKTWSDATDLQQQWAQQATEDYLAEAQRLAELGQKVMQQNGKVLAERAQPLTNWTATQAPSE